MYSKSIKIIPALKKNKTFNNVSFQRNMFIRGLYCTWSMSGCDLPLHQVKETLIQRPDRGRVKSYPEMFLALINVY